MNVEYNIEILYLKTSLSELKRKKVDQSLKFKNLKKLNSSVDLTDALRSKRVI
jgi:hypothetical protein